MSQDLRKVYMRERNEGGGPNSATIDRRDAGERGEGSQGGAAGFCSGSRSAAALKLARDQRPDLGRLVHLATGAREQLELFSYAGAGGVSPPAVVAQHDLREPLADRCPSCGAALGSGEDAHSMTGDNLADHLLDYHEGDLGSAECSYRRRKEQARALAQQLRRGGAEAGVRKCT